MKVEDPETRGKSGSNHLAGNSVQEAMTDLLRNALIACAFAFALNPTVPGDSRLLAGSTGSCQAATPASRAVRRSERMMERARVMMLSLIHI